MFRPFDYGAVFICKVLFLFSFSIFWSLRCKIPRPLCPCSKLHVLFMLPKVLYLVSPLVICLIIFQGCGSTDYNSGKIIMFPHPHAFIFLD